MQTTTYETVRCMLLASLWLAAGCTSPTLVPRPEPAVCADHVTPAAAVQVAGQVLADMDFPIEKLDARQGVIRTRPLRAGQFFEFWRSDNRGLFSTAEANLQTIRRSVDVRVTRDSGRTCIDCRVQVQRLALPESEIASISQAYRIYTRSERLMQRFEVRPQQQQGMAWIELGEDPQLAAEILKRIAQRLERLD